MPIGINGLVAPGGLSGLYLPFNADIIAKLGGEEGLKAVLAGGTNGLNASGFVPENLEQQAHVTLWDRDDLHFIRELPEVDATSVFHEFEVVDDYGSVMGSPLFQAESGLGAQTAYSGKRHVTRIVTLSHVNKVSGLARAQKNIEVLGSTDPLVSNRNAQMLVHLFKKAVQTIFCEADASMSTLRFSGLLEQFWKKNASAAFADKPKGVDPQLMVDLRGKPLTRKHIELASTSMFSDGWGSLNRIYMDPDVSQGFQGEIETNFPVERLTMGQAPNELIIGAPVAGVKAQGGIVFFKVDNSFHPQFYYTDPADEAARKGKPYTYESGSPAKPVAAPTVAVAANIAGSLWQAADIPAAPAIKYKVQPCNNFGIGPISDASAAAAIAANGRNTVSWASAADALSYKVFRNSVDDPNRYFVIGEVKNNGANLSFVDLNHWMPGTSVAVGFEMRVPKTATNRLNARAKDNAVRAAKLEGLHTEPMGKLGDFVWELLLERMAPELVQALRMRVFFNVANRFVSR